MGKSIKERIDLVIKGAEQMYHECSYFGDGRTLRCFEETVSHLKRLSHDMSQGMCSKCDSVLEEGDYLEEKICKACMKHLAMGER